MIFLPFYILLFACFFLILVHNPKERAHMNTPYITRISTNYTQVLMLPNRTRLISSLTKDL